MKLSLGLDTRDAEPGVVRVLILCDGNIGVAYVPVLKFELLQSILLIGQGGVPAIYDEKDDALGRAESEAHK